jgi:hypothetical protein
MLRATELTLVESVSWYNIPLTPMYGSETATSFEFANEASPLADQPSLEPLVNHVLEPLVNHLLGTSRQSRRKLCRVFDHQMLAAVDDSSRHPSSKVAHPLQQWRDEPHLATKRTAADRSGLGDRAATLRLGHKLQYRSLNSHNKNQEINHEGELTWSWSC